MCSSSRCSPCVGGPRRIARRTERVGTGARKSTTPWDLGTDVGAASPGSDHGAVAGSLRRGMATGALVSDDRLCRRHSGTARVGPFVAVATSGPAGSNSGRKKTRRLRAVLLEAAGNSRSPTAGRNRRRLRNISAPVRASRCCIDPVPGEDIAPPSARLDGVDRDLLPSFRRQRQLPRCVLIVHIVRVLPVLDRDRALEMFGVRPVARVPADRVGASSPDQSRRSSVARRTTAPCRSGSGRAIWGAARRTRPIRASRICGDRRP